jgi:4'-phosphopantetheinyl transferase
MPKAVPMSLSDATIWHETPKILPLGPDEIHIWRIGLVWPDIVENRLKIYLTEEEFRRAAGFHFAHDRRRFIHRRVVLRRLLASYLGVRVDLVRLLSGPYGKPFIRGQEELDGIRFNCSHSGDFGLIAISRRGELGCDVEQHRQLEDAEDLAANCFSASEIKEMNALPESLKTKGFFNCWTRKESFVKAIGVGLSFPLNRLSVSLIPGQPATLLEVAEDPEAVNRWKMASLDVSQNSSAALVFEDRNAGMQYFEWGPRLLDLPIQA